MEAFEKWIATKCGICCKQGREAGWRAALKWTLKTEKELEEQDVPISMRDVIEKELGDK